MFLLCFCALSTQQGGYVRATNLYYYYYYYYYQSVGTIITIGTQCCMPIVRSLSPAHCPLPFSHPSRK